MVDGDRRVRVLSSGVELDARVVTLDDDLPRLEYEVVAGSRLMSIAGPPP